MAIIRKVQRIKSFGVYSDFRWSPELPAFNRYNLLYGWNYSGKTTLSRVFRCFELKQAHSDFMEAEIKLETDDGQNHESPTQWTGPVVRVFNADFVRENLSFDDGNANPILILGKEDIEKQNILERKKGENDRLLLEIEDQRREKKSIIDGIESAKTSKARDIKRMHSLPDYDKTRFGQQIDVVVADVDRHVLSDIKFQQTMTTSLSSDKKPELSRKSSVLISASALEDRASQLLKWTVTAKAIERLKADPELEKWVNAGRSIHEKSNNCQFCGSPLPSGLLDKLGEHFSTDYENLMRDLASLIEDVESAASESLSLDDEARLYPELSSEYRIVKTKLEELLQKRKSALMTLADTLRDKQTKAFAVCQCPNIDDLSEELSGLISSVNVEIDAHNRRTREFEQLKQDSIAQIEKHYAALFISEQDYKQKLQAIIDLEKALTEKVERQTALNAEILTLEIEVSKAATGAERINSYLRGYFGKDDLQLIASAANHFLITRQGVAAKNLSEGEKTAIAFAYFITHLEEMGADVAETIVFIDDPISSLDANHLFNTVSLIKTKLAGCRQLFVSTHNFEFFNLLRDWLIDIEKPSKTLLHKDLKKWRAFLIERASASQSAIREIPRELISFKSEYHYLFSVLHLFTSLTEVDFAQLFNLPNVTRRFMEAFGGIMIPSYAGLQKKMEKLFPDAVERERVWKFINHYSHNTSVTRSLTVPDTSECKAVIACCLGAVQRWNKEHYDALVEAIT